MELRPGAGKGWQTEEELGGLKELPNRIPKFFSWVGQSRVA